MYDAIVLAGGAARRLDGAIKPQLDVGGSRLIDRVLAAVGDARTIVVVGPTQPTDVPVQWCLESPPGGGPVAAVAAAITLTNAATVVLLAADLPFVAPAVAPLLAAVEQVDVAAVAPVDVAHLVDRDGRANHLAAAWRREALVRALAAQGDPAGVSMRALLTGATVAAVDDPFGWGADCDTWDDVARARAAVADR